MTQYNTFNVKLSDLPLNQLKSGTLVPEFQEYQQYQEYQ